MTLNIGSAITNGLGRAVNRNGLLLILVAAVVGLGWQVVFNSIVVEVLPPDVTESLGMTVDASLGVLLVVGTVLFLVLPYISIVAARTFVAGETNRIPREYLRRRVPWVLVNLVVGGIVYSVLLFVGTLLFVIPGIVVYLGLLFSTIYITVEDENFVAAMIDSWNLTRGNWIRLFILMLIIVVPFTLGFMFLSIATSVVFGINSLESQVVSALIPMPFGIILLGILAEAFVQLRSDDPDGRPDEVRMVD